MVQRIRMNFEVQRIWPQGPGGGGPYPGYWIVNAMRKNKWKSTGEAFARQNLYAKAVAGAGGNTVAVDFFFRRYLLFVDWGVGAGMKKEQVDRTKLPNMRSRYAVWTQTGDRKRRPVVMGAIMGSRFFLGKILEDYWQKEGELAVLYGLGFTDTETGEYIEFAGGID